MSAKKLQALLALVVAAAAALAAAWSTVKPKLDAFLDDETVVVVPLDGGVGDSGASDDAGR